MNKHDEEIKQLLIRMPRKLWKYLKRHAMEKETSMNAIMVDWLLTRKASMIQKQKMLKMAKTKSLQDNEKNDIKISA